MSTPIKLFWDPSVQGKCCGNNPPYWQASEIRHSDPILAYGGEYRNSKDHTLLPGTWVEGAASGYRPPWLSVSDWMLWQGCRWSTARTADGLPCPAGWEIDPSIEKKVRVGGGQSGLQFQWCRACETALESAWSGALEALPLAARAIAMVASYVPVWGTAISFTINASVALAQGERFDQAVLDGIGQALPGQPATGAAFSAMRSIANGENIDKIVIAGLPIDDSVKQIIAVADHITYGVVTGEGLDDYGLEAVKDFLPPEASAAIDYARRIADGENVPQIVLTAVEQEVLSRIQAQARAIVDAARDQVPSVVLAAKAKAEALLNSYAAQAGYQMAVDRLSPEMRDALKGGLVVGTVDRHQYIGTFDTSEKNAEAHDDMASKGMAIVDSGAMWKGHRLSTILGSKLLALDIDVYDALSGHTVTRSATYTIDSDFRRGFLVALGTCQGNSDDGPGQKLVRAQLGNLHAQNGFDAGQAIQFWRTKNPYGFETEIFDRSDHSAISALHSALAKFDKENLGIDPAATRKANDGLAVKGKLIASRNSGIRNYRSNFTNLSWLRGFDIGIAVCGGKSTIDNDTTSVLSSLSGIPEQQDGFLAAQSVQTSISKGNPMPALGRVLSAARRVQLNDLIAHGAQIAAQSPAIRAVRGGSPAFVKGYDAATAACAGSSMPGPGQSSIRWDVAQMVTDDRIGTAADAQAGFDLGQALQHGITKAGTGREVISGNPDVAAGQLVVHGIAGSSISPDQKAAVVSNAIAGNAGAKAGAAATIEHKKSLWQSFLDFFGL